MTKLLCVVVRNGKPKIEKVTEQLNVEEATFYLSS